MTILTPPPLRHFFKVSCLAAFLFCPIVQLHAQAAAPAALPEGDGKDLVGVACTQCHGLEPIIMLRDGPAGWKIVVHEMIMRGAQLLPQESDKVIQYLSRNFGPSAGPMETGTLPEKVAASKYGNAVDAEPASLPSGEGRELVASRCTLCHGLERVTAEKRSKEEWRNIVKNMSERGLSVATAEVERISSYLAAQFGMKGK